MVAAGDGGSGARYAAALCVMYWLLLSYPVTLIIASVATILVTALIYLKVRPYYVKHGALRPQKPLRLIRDGEVGGGGGGKFIS